LELLAAESFSYVFCKNLFGTTPSLMQFKSAPVSNRAIVSSLKSSEKTRIILIKYFLEDIWVSMFKKSSGICSIFVSVCGMHEIQWFDPLYQTQYQTGFQFWTEDVVVLERVSSVDNL
jgi:hypothetical protein